jgi:cytochrome c551/c552
MNHFLFKSLFVLCIGTLAISNVNAQAKGSVEKTTVTYKEVEPLLKKYTCAACHTESKKLVGPSYKEIAKKEYTDEKMLKLIYKPEPDNWPDFPAPMAPMPQVKKVDGLKIAAWINSLN